MIRGLHLASFNGNIGDAINHKGFWNCFRTYITDDVQYESLEMREFYKSWGIRKFDNDFVKLVNTYDFLIIGGGNFFDICWENSATGTTIDMQNCILNKIRVPIIFNGLGVDINHNTNNNQIKKFEEFLQNCIKRERTVISVRNDSSKDIIESQFPDISKYIVEIPDGGFFTSCRDYLHAEIPANHTIIAVNIACDRASIRWPKDEFSFNDFCNEFSKFTTKLLKNDCRNHIVFVPHIPSDIEAISKILGNIEDYYLRNRVSVAPYLNGTITPADYIVDLYKKSDIVIAMRYHANIASIAMLTPAIGIVTINKHRKLYEKIGMEDRLLDVTTEFGSNLLLLCEEVLSNKEVYIKENIDLLNRLKIENGKYFSIVKKVLF